MQSFIKLFGSGINFYGGPGEAAHKTFMKSAGQKLKEEWANLHNKLHINITIWCYHHVQSST